MTGDTWDKMLAAIIGGVLIALLYSCIDWAEAAEVQGPPAVDAAEPPVLVVVYACPSGNLVTVGTNHADIHLAHMMLVLGRISREQYFAVLTSLKPEYRDSGGQFLVNCFGAPT